MKLLMALAVLLGSALPDVRVVAWWGVERLDRADWPGTGREVRRAPVDRGLGLALGWRCCVGDPGRSGPDVFASDASVFDGHDVALDGPIDETNWSPVAAEWTSPTPPAVGLSLSGVGSGLTESDKAPPSRLEPGRTGRPVCAYPCAAPSSMDLIDADEARALTALRAAEGRR